MAIKEYEYAVELCDVPEVRRAALQEYRLFRRKCLEYLRGAADTSVSAQVHGLAWYTVVFRTLNEARRLEPERAVNGAMWELITAGYSNMMAMGIRKLVDKDSRTDSVWNVIAQIEKRPELLRRENFVCYDGIPYDSKAAFKRHVDSLDMSKGNYVRWVATQGPEAWGMSQMLQEAFDALTGSPMKRKRLDTVQPSVIDNLKAQLGHPTIVKVCNMADRMMAHAERLAPDDESVQVATYNDIDEALRIVVCVTNFLSSRIFYDVTFGSVVPMPQFNVLEALDQPWVTTANLSALQVHWDELTKSINNWVYEPDEHFLLRKPG